MQKGQRVKGMMAKEKEGGGRERKKAYEKEKGKGSLPAMDGFQNNFLAVFLYTQTGCSLLMITPIEPSLPLIMSI